MELSVVALSTSNVVTLTPPRGNVFFEPCLIESGRVVPVGEEGSRSVAESPLMMGTALSLVVSTSQTSCSAEG